MIEKLKPRETKGEYIRDSRPIRSAWDSTHLHGQIGPGGISARKDDEFLPIASGQIARFKKHYALMLRAADGKQEFVHVYDDPKPDGLIVRRARGGSEPIAFDEGDRVDIIGIAVPEGDEFPLDPLGQPNA